MAFSRRVICFGVIWISLLCGGAHAAQVIGNMACPNHPLESCRWAIESRVVTDSNHSVTVTVDWEKSVQSQHWRKPAVPSLACNVDRDFNASGGGYVRVWFVGETEPCDPTRRNPADCGVTFFLADPTALYSARGFSVRAPQGKQLLRVEHYSTLNLQCGDFRQNNIANGQWNSVVGWSAQSGGDGTYQRNNPISVISGR